MFSFDMFSCIPTNQDEIIEVLPNTNRNQKTSQLPKVWRQKQEKKKKQLILYFHFCPKNLTHVFFYV